MPTSLTDGKIVFIPCEIAPGMTSIEREITIRNPEGAIRAYVTLTSVASDFKLDSEKKFDGWVKAVIVAFDKDDLRLLFTGQDVDPANPAPVSREWLRDNAKTEAQLNHRARS